MPLLSLFGCSSAITWHVICFLKQDSPVSDGYQWCIIWPAAGPCQKEAPADASVIHFCQTGCVLCRLYVNVISTIKGYGEFLWVDVVEQIDSMTEQVNGFQAQCKKLPKVSFSRLDL